MDEGAFVIDNCRPAGSLLETTEAAARERERIFERFTRGSAGPAGSGHDSQDKTRPGRAPGGHGLGLPLARHVAQLHGGDVRLDDSSDLDSQNSMDSQRNVSAGVTFILDLPSWTNDPATRP